MAKKVSKSELKAKMFEHFRDLEENGGVLIVTDCGKPKLQILPFREKKSVEEAFSDVRGKVKNRRADILRSELKLNQ